MSDNSAIEWTDATWNPVVGCSRVSAGCDHCYAVGMTRRLEGMSKAPGLGGEGKAKYRGLTIELPQAALDRSVGVNGRHFNGEVRCVEEALKIPLRWKKPVRIFVNSMSDLFHPKVPFEFIDRVFAVMALCPRHTFQVLTKRPERMVEYFNHSRDTLGFKTDERVASEMVAIDHRHPGVALAGRRAWPLPNVWLGTSCEDQAAADDRIPELLKCPAAVRFLSCEPLLGPVDIWSSVEKAEDRADVQEALVGFWRRASTHLQWVIVGGESGPGARPCNVDWIRSIVQQCSGVLPCFVKQLGSRPEVRHPSDHRECPFYRDGGFLYPWVPEWAAAWIRKFDRKGGDPSEWPEELRVRELPGGAA